MNMNPFYAIYNKGIYMQFAFNNFNLHPDYIGAEFPLGQSLTAAINISPDEAYIAFDELTRSYMSYLDNKTIETYNAFLIAIYNMDEYCIYLREIVHKILEMVDKLHPRYAPSYLTHFISFFRKKECLDLLDAISKINAEPNQREHKSYFWNLCVKFMLDAFLEDIKHLKEDIYELCNISDGYSGKSRLNSLNNSRKLFYFGLEFPIHPGTSIGEAENSKILSSGPVGSDEIIDCLFSDEVITAMYYEFYTVLEKNLPIRLCKNCNKPFVAQKRADSIYCDRVIPGSKDKCSVVGPLKTYRSKLPDIESDFYAARRRYNTRVSRNPLLKTEFEVWKIKSREKLIAYREGNLSADEFRKWFMDDEWMKLN